MSNRCGTADSLLQIRKILFNIITERVDRTDARNNYSSFCHKFKAIRGCESSFYKLFLVLFDILDSVANGSDLLSVLVRNLDIESLLELHDQFYGVERISTQMVGEYVYKRQGLKYEPMFDSGRSNPLVVFVGAAYRF